jgi:mono/diheme cytochrome c family protein
MKTRAVMIGFVLGALSPAALPAEGDAMTGRQVFERHCIHCHGDDPESAGTRQLARRLGPEKAVLSERDDLAGAYVRQVVRRGLNAMPPFAPADLTEAKLDALIDYLTQ